MNRVILISSITLIVVCVLGITLALTLGAGWVPSNWVLAMSMLALAGIGGIAWSLPDRVDFLGRSRTMMGSIFFGVGCLFAVLSMFGIVPTK